MPIVIRTTDSSFFGHGIGLASRRRPMLVQLGNQRWRLEPGENRIDLPPGVWPVSVWCLYYGLKVG